MLIRGVTLNQSILQSDQLQRLENTESQIDSFSVENKIITSVWQDLVEENIDTNQETLRRCIRLSFDELQSFEKLHNQFRHLGLIFDNCLVIQPSNPAFPSRSGLKVVMASPKNGFLSVKFLNPVNLVSILVTSSQRLVLSAYDQDEQLVKESVLPTANIVNSGSDIPPNATLSVTANCIKSIHCGCFDGQFTLDELRFCFSNL